MAESTEKKGFLSGILSLPNDDPKKTLFVAVLLCLVCSVLVSTAAVSLKTLQTTNKQNDIKKNILAVTGQLDKDGTVEELFAQFEVKLVDLESGDFADTDIDPVSYDQRKASADPAMSVSLSSADDVAGIGSRAKLVPVYMLKDGDKIEQIVIPVHSYGLWSTMYGFLSLEGDFNTVKGLRFYEHAETPGLGGEIDNPKWRAQWTGKKVFNIDGSVGLHVIRGFVGTSTSNPEYKIDGLSGATLTSNGVTNMMTYWFGDNAFGPFLKNMQTKLGN